MRTVGLTNFELARVLQGHPMTCSLDDGEEVTVRLFTADEFVAVNAAAVAELFPNGGGPAPISRADAIRLTTPAPEVSP